jgi:Gpi18-like mannosyltransferase
MKKRLEAVRIGKLMSKKNLKYILKVFIFWQAFLVLIIFLGGKYVPTTWQYLYTEPERVINPVWLWSRANFDGIHYLDIAKWNYGLHQQAFFPLYPRLISALTFLFGGRDLLAGLFISWTTSLGALFFLYCLVRLDFKEKIAQRTILYFLIFPTAFFL